MTPHYRPQETRMTVAEVAAELHVSKMTVYRLVHDKTLRAVRVGRSLRILERHFDAYLRSAETGEWTHLEGEA